MYSCIMCVQLYRTAVSGCSVYTAVLVPTSRKRTLEILENLVDYVNCMGGYFRMRNISHLDTT
jgi:hypothetical protein